MKACSTCPCYTMPSVGASINLHPVNGACETRLHCQFVDSASKEFLELHSALVTASNLPDAKAAMDNYFRTLKGISLVFNCQKTAISSIYGGLLHFLTVDSPVTTTAQAVQWVVDAVCWVRATKVADGACSDALLSIGLAMHGFLQGLGGAADANIDELVAQFTLAQQRIIDSHPGCCSLAPFSGPDVTPVRR